MGQDTDKSGIFGACAVMPAWAGEWSDTVAVAVSAKPAAPVIAAHGTTSRSRLITA
jgi:hypothetical protein